MPNYTVRYYYHTYADIEVTTNTPGFDFIDEVNQKQFVTENFKRQMIKNASLTEEHNPGIVVFDSKGDEVDYDGDLSPVPDQDQVSGACLPEEG